MMRVLFLFIAFSTVTTQFFCQKGTVASGVEATGSGGTVSATIGQIDFNYQNGAGGNLNEGVQQPYELDVTLGVANSNINLIANVFPNPTQNFLTLSIQDFTLNSYVFSLIDAAGKLIFTSNVDAPLKAIDLSSFSNGIYVLSVYQGNKLEKQFRVVKHQ